MLRARCDASTSAEGGSAFARRGTAFVGGCCADGPYVDASSRSTSDSLRSTLQGVKFIAAGFRSRENFKTGIYAVDFTSDQGLSTAIPEASRNKRESPGVQLRQSHIGVLVFIASGLVASCSDGSFGSKGDPRVELYSVTVIGKGSILSKLKAQGLSPAHEPGAGDDSSVVLESTPGTDWGSVYQLRADIGGAKISLAPWLCPMLSDVQHAIEIEAGSAVTETRVVELDEDEVFWTTGRYGQSFPTTCEWYTSRSSGRSVSEKQDGPCLCAEDDRKRTALTFQSSDDGRLSEPEVCVAYFGAYRGGTVALSIMNQHAPSDEIGFTLVLKHCLEPDETIPLKVEASELLSSKCPMEMAALRLGNYLEGRPKVVPLRSGTWDVHSASRDRSLRHVSDVDLVFGNDTMSIHVQGHIDLPQNMTE